MAAPADRPDYTPHTSAGYFTCPICGYLVSKRDGPSHTKDHLEAKK